MLSAIIVDDDYRDREILELMINKYCSDSVVIAGTAGNISDARQLILEKKPRLVFLDIELGNETGFDLLSTFDPCPFRVVFVTAYDKYAIRAIKFSALDYILKPIDITELVKAVQKAAEDEKKTITYDIKNLLEVLSRPGNKNNQVAVPTLTGFQFIQVEEIIFCEANKEYTFLHCMHQPVICSCINLGEYEDLLEDYSFLRVHHSYLVNKQHIRQYIKGEGGELVLTNEHKIPVSRRKKQDLIERLTHQKKES